MKRRLVAGTVAVAAAAVVAVATGAEAPPGDAVPPVWPLPATALGAAGFALSVHTVATDRLRPASVTATTATVQLAVLATVPSLNYTLHSLSAPYILVGITVLPAALAAAAKLGRRHLALALAFGVVALGAAGGVHDESRPVLSFFAVHLARSLPAGLLGYGLTAVESSATGDGGL